MTNFEKVKEALSNLPTPRNQDFAEVDALMDQFQISDVGERWSIKNGIEAWLKEQRPVWFKLNPTAVLLVKQASGLPRDVVEDTLTDEIAKWFTDLNVASIHATKSKRTRRTTAVHGVELTFDYSGKWRRISVYSEGFNVIRKGSLADKIKHFEDLKLDAVLLTDPV